MTARSRAACVCRDPDGCGPGLDSSLCRSASNAKKLPFLPLKGGFGHPVTAHGAVSSTHTQQVAHMVQSVTNLLNCAPVYLLYLAQSNPNTGGVGTSHPHLQVGPKTIPIHRFSCYLKHSY